MTKTIGQQIRDIADRVERLDPTRAPFFTGFERPSPGAKARGMFQGKTIMGEAESLVYALLVLAELAASGCVLQGEGGC